LLIFFPHFSAGKIDLQVTVRKISVLPNLLRVLDGQHGAHRSDQFGGRERLDDVIICANIGRARGLFFTLAVA
jgi:hypothetical protein